MTTPPAPDETTKKSTTMRDKGGGSGTGTGSGGNHHHHHHHPRRRHDPMDTILLLMLGSGAMIVTMIVILAISSWSASVVTMANFMDNNDHCPPPCVPGSSSIMNQKEHGTSHVPVMKGLLYNVNWDTADRICNFNRHYAERAGYFMSRGVTFMDAVREVQDRGGGGGGGGGDVGNDDKNEGEEDEQTTTTSTTMTMYDSNTGEALFRFPAGKDRTMDDFLAESKRHGWPSFRDEEVLWDQVRVIASTGEVVSIGGTHLGHNLPDRRGNRYCINLVSIAGRPSSSSTTTSTSATMTTTTMMMAGTCPGDVGCEEEGEDNDGADEEQERTEQEERSDMLPKDMPKNDGNDAREGDDEEEEDDEEEQD